MCRHITFMRLARIQRVMTAPSRIRAASSNPAHAPHRGSCGQPVSGLHACWRGHTAATEIPTDRRSGRRGNRRSYHAPAIKGGAGEPSSSSAPLPPCPLRLKQNRRRAVRIPSRRSAAPPELAPDLRRRNALGNRLTAIFRESPGKLLRLTTNTHPHRRAIDLLAAFF